MKSRRDFLKIAGLSAFALGTASALTLATGSKASALPAGTAPAKGSYTNEPDALHAKRWAMVIDTRKFTSPEHFQRVIDACHHAHNVPTIPGNQDVKWIWTDKYAHVFPDDVNAYMPEKFLHGDFLSRLIILLSDFREWPVRSPSRFADRRSAKYSRARLSNNGWCPQH